MTLPGVQDFRWRNSVAHWNMQASLPQQGDSPWRGQMHTQTHTHAHIHRHIHTHTHTQTHTHIQRHSDCIHDIAPVNWQLTQFLAHLLKNSRIMYSLQNQHTNTYTNAHTINSSVHMLSYTTWDREQQECRNIDDAIFTKLVMIKILFWSVSINK